MARQVAVDAARCGSRGSPRRIPDHLELVVQLRGRYDQEASHAATARRDARRGGPGAARPPGDPDLDLAAQREAVIRLRDDGDIGDEALHRVERDLDLEAVRCGV